MKKIKGFTLVELVVVLAIIGILATTVTPNMFGRVQKSKFDSAQSQARSIFNSAQTIVQKYETLDRAITDSNKKFLRENIQNAGNNAHYFGNISYNKIDDEKSADNKVGTDFYTKLSAMNLHINDGKWIVIVEDYKVTHVLWAEDENNKYVGVYCGCGSHTNYESYKDDTTKNIIDVLGKVD